MRKVIVAASFAGVVLGSKAASASMSHYIVIKTIDNTTDTASVTPPDLTPTASATHTSGAVGDPATVANRGSVNSTSGVFELEARASQQAGTATLDPKAWLHVARLEEVIKPGSTPPTSITAKLSWNASGTLVQATPGTIKTIATLAVNGCSVRVVRTFVTSSQSAPADDTIENCGLTGYTTAGNSGLLTVTWSNFKTSAGIDVQIESDYSWSGAFVGSLATNISATLTIEATGGSIVGTAPGFLTSGAGADGGATSSSGGSSGATSSSGGGASSGGTGSTSSGAAPNDTAPPSGDDGGCHASRAERSGAGAAFLAAAALASALVRRRRRAR